MINDLQAEIKSICSTISTAGPRLSGGGMRLNEALQMSLSPATSSSYTCRIERSNSGVGLKLFLPVFSLTTTEAEVLPASWYRSAASAPKPIGLKGLLFQLDGLLPPVHPSAAGSQAAAMTDVTFWTMSSPHRVHDLNLPRMSEKLLADPPSSPSLHTGFIHTGQSSSLSDLPDLQVVIDVITWCLLWPIPDQHSRPITKQHTGALMEPFPGCHPEAPSRPGTLSGAQVQSEPSCQRLAASQWWSSCSPTQQPSAGDSKPSDNIRLTPIVRSNVPRRQIRTVTVLSFSIIMGAI